MLASIAQLFAPKFTRSNYCYHPPLGKITRAQPRSTLVAADVYLLQDLGVPIEEWIVGRESQLESYFVMETVYRFIICHAAHARDITCPPYQISLHNVFALITRFQVLNRILEQRVREELELLVDGMCGMYLKYSTSQPNHHLDLICAIHYCLLFGGTLKTQNLRNLITVCSGMQEWNVDQVTNAVIMLAKLCKVMQDDQIIVVIPKLASIALELLNIIQYQVECVLYLQNCGHEGSSLHLQQLRVDYAVRGCMLRDSQLLKRVKEKANILLEMEGFISPKALYQFAYSQFSMMEALHLQLYILKLMANPTRELQSLSYRSIVKVLEAAHLYDFNVNDQTLLLIQKMLNLLCQENKHIHENLLIKSFCTKNQSCVFAQQINCCQVKQFLKEAETTEQVISCELLDFRLERTPSILYYLLHQLYDLKLEYLPLLESILRAHPKLQNYFLKNELLHFIMHQFETFSTITASHFNIITELLRHNPIAHRLLNELIRKQIQDHGESPIAVSIKAYLPLAIPLLTVLVTHSHLHPLLLTLVLQNPLINDIYGELDAQDTKCVANIRIITLVLLFDMKVAKREGIKQNMISLCTICHQEWQIYYNQIYLTHSRDPLKEEHGGNINFLTLRDINKRILKNLK